MAKLAVIDNIISPGYQNYLEGLIGGTTFPWFYDPQITDNREGSKDINGGFFHKVWYSPTDFTPFAEMTYGLLFEGTHKYRKGSFNELLRIRAAMFTKDQTKYEHKPHVDFEDVQHHVMLYYVNDSDGPTKIYEGDKVVKEVVPKKGRAVFFPGRTYHASSSPKHHSKRIVLNFNYR